MSKQFAIPEMPIFWREVTDLKPVEGIPSKMEILLEGPQEWGGISIRSTPELTTTLQRIYREDENIGYLQDDNPLAELYAPEYISFVKRYAKQGGHISEIGAGGCYSLDKLKSLGFRVSAIDPSPITKVIGKRLGIDVIPEFFPLENNAFLKGVDACIHYDVLEHVEKPIEFLHSIWAGLPEGGKTIFVVPDSSSHITEIDVSMCIHQHLNYFSKNSLTNLVRLAGFKVEALKRSNSTGTIFCSAVKETGKNAQSIISAESQVLAQNETRLFMDNVEEKYERKVRALTKIIGEKNTGKTAFYPPLRAIPFLSPIIDRFSEDICFVDDNTKVQEHYICDLKIKICSREEALQKGVTKFVICSRPFKQVMVQKLLQLHDVCSDDIYFLDELN